MSEIQPPFYDDDLGPAPTGVCSRWMGDSPCGAAGTHHVIWDSNLTNGCMCQPHVAEARARWVYIGLHPYTSDCVAFTVGEADWLPGEDRCAAVTPDPAAVRDTALTRGFRPRASAGAAPAAVPGGSQ
jgi:hypothetical protein